MMIDILIGDDLCEVVGVVKDELFVFVGGTEVGNLYAEIRSRSKGAILRDKNNLVLKNMSEQP